MTGPGQEAVLRYEPADFVVVKPGDFVRCAVTGKPIPLERLTYWSAALQEAYAGPEYMTRRWVETH